MYYLCNPVLKERGSSIQLLLKTRKVLVKSIGRNTKKASKSNIYNVNGLSSFLNSVKMDKVE